VTEDQGKVIAKIAAKLSLLGTPATPQPDVSVGPVVTVYRFKPIGATKFAQIEGLARDIAITLGAEDVVVKRLPGETNVAVFVPNAERKMIDFKETITNVWNSTTKIPLNFGVDYLGNKFVEDLAELPHLLVAGSTGSGKSTLVSSIIASIIYCREANDISLILSDTKNVEFGRFVGAPHLTSLPATTVEDTLGQIEALISKMEERLETFGKKRMRNLFEYEEAFPNALKYNRIVFIIDELADILCDETREENDKGKPVGPTLGNKCQKALAKLVQKARAAGIHVIACTQRPSVNIVSGTIKANFPARLSFRLPTGFDSRTVLGFDGAEHLLSKGDCLYVSPNRHDVMRLHTPFALNTDIDAAVNYATQKVTI